LLLGTKNEFIAVAVRMLRACCAVDKVYRMFFRVSIGGWQQVVGMASQRVLW